MYGVAYVILPMESAPLQRALDEALAPFQRGGLEEFSLEKLAFDDVTGHLRKLHAESLTLNSESASVVVCGGNPAMVADLDFDALREFLEIVGAEFWSGRLADVEPDFEAFVYRFTKWKERDPLAGGYGSWINPLGRWDWWDLGGRFDGLIVGERRHAAGESSMVSSGPSRGRDALGIILRAFGAESSEFEAEITANVDLVSALLEAARRGEKHAFPTAIVLPVGACAPEFRWFDALGWRPVPAETKALVLAPDDATFEETAMAAYERFAHMAVAGIAYHF